MVALAQIDRHTAIYSLSIATNYSQITEFAEIFKLILFEGGAVLCSSGREHISFCKTNF